jgi:hypothetical protein
VWVFEIIYNYPLMFFPQQQVGTAVSALHEKIDRLSEENKRLQEQLHQYAPNY